MKARFRDSMSWLHTWSGLVGGWILFTVFLTGTLSYFQYEITAWMRPDLENRAIPNNSIGQAQAFLTAKSPNSPRWSISLPTERSPITTLFWRNVNPEFRGFQRATLDGNGKEIKIRETLGGSFLYRFHFDLYYVPVYLARWIVGICAMLMLVAIICGIIIHKKIFKDFFTFEPGKGARTWLDAHTLTSVLALPFHLMITYTGLITLMFMYMSWSLSLSFGDRTSLYEVLEQKIEIPEKTGNFAEMLPLNSLYLKASAYLESAPISFVVVHNPGDKNATISFTESPNSSLISDYRTLIYSAVTGKLLGIDSINSSAELARKTMINLHSGRFADPQLRWLYFLSGVLGTMMIASGLILWSEKRQKKLKLGVSTPLGLHFVSRLNVGFILGLPMAIGVYFLSNRLLPADLNERAEMEICCFFIGWLVMLIYPIFKNIKDSWHDGVFFIGLLYLTLPLVSIVTVKRHLFSYNYPQDIQLLFVDISLLIVGMSFLFTWRKQKSRAENGIRCI